MKILQVLANRKFLFIFLLLSAFFTVVYYIVTGIYVVSIGGFLESAEPLRVAFATLISILTALAATLMLYKREQPLVCSQNAPAFLGSTVALFTSGCSFCFPLLLSVAGVGGSAALAISSNAVPIQIASISLLVASLWLTTRS